MTRVRRFLVALTGLASLVLAAAVPTFAQTTPNSTTLAADVTTSKQQIITLASVTNINGPTINLGGDLLVMDREAMLVNSVNTASKQVTVMRGVGGSKASPHSSGIVVWTGPRKAYYRDQVVGKCTPANELYLPHIVLPGANSILGGDVFDCVTNGAATGVWTLFKQGGYTRSAGLLDTSANTSGTVQNTEYTVNTVTIPATEWAGARGVRCVAFGTTAANANAKNLKFYFGSTVLVTDTGTTDNAKDYSAEIVVFRTGASTQAGYGSLNSTTATLPAASTSMTEAETATIVVKFTSANTAAAAASATGKGLYCNWLP